MRPLEQEFKVDLAEVERWWIRIPATLIITLVAVTVMLFIDILKSLYTTWREFIKPCLLGPRKKSNEIDK